MNLSFRTEAAAAYRGATQRIRVLSEDWVARNVYCPNCGEQRLTPFKNNQPAADFKCGTCADQFELKSTGGRFGPRLVNGAYQALINRLNAADNPNLFLLGYNKPELSVTDLQIVPKHFLTPQLIEPRKPLSASARRSGWVGCNILIGAIPQSGRIALIRDRRATPKEEVLRDWASTRFLRADGATESKSWLVATMGVIEGLKQTEFTLADIYANETRFKRLFRSNQNVQAKLRQQLQRLRDVGYLEFLGAGRYRRVSVRAPGSAEGGLDACSHPC